jgi:hypothetical protein
MVPAQEERQRVLQDLHCSCLHLLEVMGPPEVRAHIAVVPYAKAETLPLVGAAGQVGAQLP